jgi:hypothetical protein
VTSTCLLDTFRTHGYKAALVFGRVVVLAAGAVGCCGRLGGEGARCSRVGASRSERYRYKSPSNWKDTLTWIEKMYLRTTVPVIRRS